MIPGIALPTHPAWARRPALGWAGAERRVPRQTRSRELFTPATIVVAMAYKGTLPVLRLARIAFDAKRAVIEGCIC